MHGVCLWRNVNLRPKSSDLSVTWQGLNGWNITTIFCRFYELLYIETRGVTSKKYKRVHFGQWPPNLPTYPKTKTQRIYPLFFRKGPFSLYFSCPYFVPELKFVSASTSNTSFSASTSNMSTSFNFWHQITTKKHQFNEIWRYLPGSASHHCLTGPRVFRVGQQIN